MSDASVSPLSFQILVALAARDRHGYLIRKAVEQQSAGAIRPGAGALYAAIRRLEDAGLIAESKWRPDADLDDIRRRYYCLTKTGRSALRAETERLRATVKFALTQLRSRPAT